MIIIAASVQPDMHRQARLNSPFVALKLVLFFCWTRRGGQSTHSLSLKGTNSLNLTANIVINTLECLENGFTLGNDFLILQNLSVVFKIDSRFGLRQLGVRKSSVGRSLTESGEGGDRVCLSREMAAERGVFLAVDVFSGGVGGGGRQERDGISGQ